MRSITKLLLLIGLSALLAGPTASIAQSEPKAQTNQCITIPEIFKGQRADEKPTVPYQPESCVALNNENPGNEESAGI